MRLFIAEKPKMAAALAAFLPGPHSRKDGYIETAGGYVTWCVGHILQQAGPEAYGEHFKVWSVDNLPILPEQWKMEITDDKRKQVSTIKALLKSCSSVVNAGDPGREGQLIVDEVLEYLGNKKPVERILLAAWDKASVMKALNTMVDNRQFHNLYLAALGRQRADWLVGMNMTRAYSSKASTEQNRRGVLSVGRVQTPTLAIVCRRDEEIENFIPKDYWSIQAQFLDAAQPTLPFWAKWLPSGVSMADLDKLEALGDGDPVDLEDEEEEDATGTSVTAASALPAWLLPPNRILDRAVADKITQELKQAAQGQVTRYENKPAKESAPLPFDATSLQALISNRHGVSVPDVLKVTQELYEKGFTTYPRTDCSYIPVSQHGEASDILTAIAKAMPDLGGLTSRADPLIQGRAFNDEKVGEHHAIIPTREAPDMSQLSEIEKHVYRAVCLQYIAQFYPDCMVDKAVVELEAGGHRLVARGRIVKSPGWRVVFGNSAEGEDTAKKNASPTLPTLVVGQQLGIQDVKNTGSQTKPPPRFTQGTLLKAMQHVDRLVTDKEVKKKLKAMDGIGRTATRPAIMETLFKRTFLAPHGKQLISTPLGRAMVKMLPEDLTNPALSARWETILDAIADGKVPLATFEQRQKMWVTQLVQTAKATPLPPLPASEAPSYGAGKGSSRSGGTSRGSSSGATRSTGASSKAAGTSKPAGGAKASSGGKKCPKCGKGEMRKREIKQGTHAGKSFLGCTNYPECKHSEWPK